ncbi:hypothetical protein [Dysgonomonas sp. ZJ279]|uniref:hypothetical protein n=1 Tax=Dysgonomonas sp. ZJ279 TaxID=2709796 RepID=UPI0013ECA620|nr:hypothetical protein [Dysgonomonas sp. ZJ279]
MRDLDRLEIYESMKNRKLTFSKKRSKKEKYSNLWLFSFLILMIILVFPQTENLYPNAEKAMKVLSVCVIILSIYMIYRLLIEENLWKIRTKYKKEDCMDILLKYADSKSFTSCTHAYNHVIVNRPRRFHPGCETTMIFLIEDNAVYYTVIQDGVKGDLPVAFFHWMMKRDMKKLFEENY